MSGCSFRRDSCRCLASLVSNFLPRLSLRANRRFCEFPPPFSSRPIGLNVSVCIEKFLLTPRLDQEPNDIESSHRDISRRVGRSSWCAHHQLASRATAFYYRAVERFFAWCDGRPRRRSHSRRGGEDHNLSDGLEMGQHFAPDLRSEKTISNQRPAPYRFFLMSS
jgi:hypothetical protein